VPSADVCLWSYATFQILLISQSGQDLETEMTKKKIKVLFSPLPKESS